MFFVIWDRKRAGEVSLQVIELWIRLIAHAPTGHVLSTSDVWDWAEQTTREEAKNAPSQSLQNLYSIDALAYPFDSGSLRERETREGEKNKEIYRAIFEKLRLIAI